MVKVFHENVEFLSDRLDVSKWISELYLVAHNKQRVVRIVKEVRYNKRARRPRH